MHREYRLTEAQLTGTCDAEDLPFETTEDLQIGRAHV